MLWVIAVLIQTIFFIVTENHPYIILFILCSLGLRYFSKKPWIFLAIPIVFTQFVYLYFQGSSSINVREAFSFGNKLRKLSTNEDTTTGEIPPPNTKVSKEEKENLNEEFPESGESFGKEEESSFL